MLGDRFSFGERGSDAGSGLSDVVSFSGDGYRARFADTIVLMTPDDEIRIITERIVGRVICETGSARDTARKNEMSVGRMSGEGRTDRFW